MNSIENKTLKYKGETFTWKTYMGVEILVRDLDGYVNVGKMVPEARFYVNENRNPRWVEISAFWASEWVCANLHTPPPEPKYVLSESFGNDFKGTYVHPDLIHFVLEKVDVRYSFIVAKIMNSINTQLHNTLKENNLPDDPKLVVKLVKNMEVKLEYQNDIITKLHEEMNELEDKNTDLDAKNTELDAKNIELDAKNVTLHAEVDELERVRTALETQMQELDEINMEMIEKTQDLEDVKRRLVAQKKNMRKTIEEEAVRSSINRKELKIILFKDEYYVSADQSQYWYWGTIVNKFIFPASMNIREEIKGVFGKKGAMPVFSASEYPGLIAYLEGKNPK